MTLELPLYLRLGPLLVHPHWVFEMLAYFVGAQLYAGLKRRTGDPLTADQRWWVVAASFVGAAVGGKVVFWLSEPGLTLEHALDVEFLLGGKSVVGGLIGAIAAVEWTKWRLGITTPTGDVFVVPLAVGIGIGRIGCFLTGLEDHTADRRTLRAAC
jgi:phosphatidylglycerol---prolipoprotein diacylglyceryl transferase